jgi:hypothetical protein
MVLAPAMRPAVAMSRMAEAPINRPPMVPAQGVNSVTVIVFPPAHDNMGACPEWKARAVSGHHEYLDE